MPKVKTMTIRLSEEQAKDLKILSKVSMTPQSVLVREAISLLFKPKK